MKNNKIVSSNKGSFKNIKATPLSKRKYYSQGCKLNGWFFLTEPIIFCGVSLMGESYVHLVNGIIHKDNGPAAVEKDILHHLTVYFFKNGKLENGGSPSYIRYNKQVAWNGYDFAPVKGSKKTEYIIHENGIIHSLEGVAHYTEFDSPIENYYIKGEQISLGKFNNHYEVKKKNLKEYLNLVMKESV